MELESVEDTNEADGDGDQQQPPSSQRGSVTVQKV
jgi:hypothetical protein